MGINLKVTVKKQDGIRERIPEQSTHGHHHDRESPSRACRSAFSAQQFFKVFQQRTRRNR